MTPAQLAETPRDLHSLGYARWICENTVGIPPAEANLKVISQSIEAISKAKFRDKPRPIFTAFVWLERQCELAKAEGIPTNYLFFLNGNYLEIKPPKAERPSEFKPPKKEELERLAAWKASPEYAELRKEMQALDAKMDMKQAIKRRDPQSLIPTIPHAEEQKILAKYRKS